MSWGLKDFVADPENYIREPRILIGRGSTCDVYKAIDRRTGQEVAIKEFTDFDAYYFIREVCMHIELHHLRIVRLLGFYPPKVGDDSCFGRAIIITELMPNGTLSNMLQRKFHGDPHPDFGPTELSKAMFGIVCTMMQVHELGVMHRDLKPENVFLDENFEIKIADLGFARASNDLEKTLSIGSPIFMAPELMMDNGGYDQSIDVYAFGVLLYRCYTDQAILEGETRQMRRVDMMMKAVRDGRRLRHVECIPDEWWEVITDCWQQEPRARPSFRMLRDRMLRGDLVMAGTDMEQYRDYQRRLMAELETDKGHELVIPQPEQRPDVDRNPPTVAQLAATGHPEFLRIYKKGPSEIPRDRKPFPFKRHK